MYRGGYEVAATLRHPGAVPAAGPGPDLHPGTGHDFHPDVRHGAGSLYLPAHLRGKDRRRPGKTETDFGCQKNAAKVWTSHRTDNRQGGDIMAKDKDVKKETKKKPAKTLKEKKEAKRQKKA
jgi:hypothetical protein